MQLTKYRLWNSSIVCLLYCYFTILFILFNLLLFRWAWLRVSGYTRIIGWLIVTFFSPNLSFLFLASFNLIHFIHSYRCFQINIYTYFFFLSQWLFVNSWNCWSCLWPNFGQSTNLSQKYCREWDIQGMCCVYNSYIFSCRCRNCQPSRCENIRIPTRNNIEWTPSMLIFVAFPVI